MKNRIMKIIITILLLSLAIYPQHILNPPIVYTETCGALVVLPHQVKDAVNTLKAKDCDVTVKQSELSDAHFIVYGVRMYEVGLTF